jgi:hypothetical protein
MSGLTSAPKALLDLEATAQGKASLSVVEGGTFTIDLSLFVDGAPKDEQRTVPCLCFIVTYQDRDDQQRRIIYDLGMRRDKKVTYSNAWGKVLLPLIQNIGAVFIVCVLTSSSIL